MARSQLPREQDEHPDVGGTGFRMGSPDDPGAAVPYECRRRDWRVPAVCGLLALAVALAFGRTVGYGFVNYDDNVFVYENPQIKTGFNGKSMAWAMTNNCGSVWGPLTWLSYIADWRLYGPKAGGFHLTNVLLHGATSVCLFLALRRLTDATWPSALAAALFAVHPLRVESVAWVAERKGLLSGLFFVLTLWAYAGYARRPFSWWRYLAVAVMFALGLLAKAAAVTFPFVALLLDYWPLGRMGSVAGGGEGEATPAVSARRTTVGQLVLEKIPLLAVAAVFSAVTFLTHFSGARFLETRPLFTRVGYALVSYMAYVGQLFWPANLVVLCPDPGASLAHWKIAAAALGLIGVTGALVACWRRYPYLIVGWLWYLGMMVPVSGLVQRLGNQGMADRYTYLPQIGLCLALACTAAKWSRSSRKGRLAGSLVSVGILTSLMGCAWWQTTYWRDSETLWRRALDCNLPSAKAHNNLGTALLDRGRLDEADSHFRQALELDPAYADAYHNLGETLLRRGRFGAAVLQYRKALQFDARLVKAHLSLGAALAYSGRLDQSIAQYRAALAIDPGLLDAHVGIAAGLLDQGRLHEAEIQCRKALQIQPGETRARSMLGKALAGQTADGDPVARIRKLVESKPNDAEAHGSLARILALQGNIDEAIQHYQKALEIKPNQAEIQNNLGNTLIRQHRFDEAIVHCRRALELRPGYAEAHYNLGNALASKGRVDEAVTHFQKAVEIKPDYAAAHKNLGEALEEQGKFQEAIGHWRQAVRLQPHHVAYLYRLAWALATSPATGARNGSEALEIARRAAALSHDREPTVLDALAAAYAEVGQFPDAVRTAQQALTLATDRRDDVLVSSLRSRLGLYRARTPFHEAAGPR
jgi:tetratricopeptide (TPR) repeat protein